MRSWGHTRCRNCVACSLANDAELNDVQQNHVSYRDLNVAASGTVLVIACVRTTRSTSFMNGCQTPSLFVSRHPGSGPLLRFNSLYFSSGVNHFVGSMR